MQRIMCKSKIHGAVVTEANLDYTGSITIDKVLMTAANMLAYEKVQVLNLNNGRRLETYVVPGKKSSGAICLNGAAARAGAEGDRLIIISYCILEEKDIPGFTPKLIFVDENNNIGREE
ncbi:MAG: aspartate 1-decarboxylase [Candidatus Omnitrophica bacterium]|nr:aspartate 1-decarboxylase [Candidatus Omnitrophota bacterium]